ncbi:hypothetical protein OUZ56_023350 [Daphnia magna]|uniref:Uncharacterized protein n=1 Tax=Daphnia magna TaxID=35525 RepID=A0ABR0AYY3_9CRUS|nr:hypothetical protein OUZ56_023350 [Daphnia magna]
MNSNTSLMEPFPRSYLIILLPGKNKRGDYVKIKEKHVWDSKFNRRTNPPSAYAAVEATVAYSCKND